MEALNLIIAVTASCLIIYYTVGLPAKTKNFSADRYPYRSIEFEICGLAKRCISFERGRGVAFFKVARGICRYVNRIQKLSVRHCLDAVETVIYNNGVLLKSVVKCIIPSMIALRRQGHVNGYPRVYLFCHKFVNCIKGIFDQDDFKKAAEIFDETVHLTETEKAILPDILIFVLCDYLYRIINKTEKCGDRYRRGVSDGENGRVDIDSLNSSDYVCGMFDSNENDKGLSALFEKNGISIDDKILKRRERIAISAALCDGVLSAVRSIVCEKKESPYTGSLARKMSKRRFDKKKNPHEIAALDAWAFFSGAADRRVFKFDGVRLFATIDSWGGIIVGLDGKSVFNVGLTVETPFMNIGLCDFDCVFTRFGAVFRTVAEQTEITAMCVVPPSASYLITRVSVINRTGSRMLFKVKQTCELISDGATETVSVDDVGIFMKSDGGCVGLYADKTARFDSALRRRGAFQPSKNTVEAVYYGNAEAFKAEAVSIFSTPIEDEVTHYHMARFIDDTEYFDAARTAACAFFDINSAMKCRSPENGEIPDCIVGIDELYDGNSYIDIDTIFKYETKPSDIYPAVEQQSAECEAVGTFFNDGFILPSEPFSENDIAKFVLYDGEMMARIAQTGECIGYTILDGDGAKNIFASSALYIGENGFVFSPCRSGNGDSSHVFFSPGFVRFTSYRNGLITELTRTLAHGRRAEVFIVDLENRTTDRREIDVMFCVDVGSDFVPSFSDGIFSVRNDDEQYGFKILSSQPFDEFCLYYEGCHRRGRVLTRGFGKSGHRPCPTGVTKIVIGPQEKRRLSFCIAVSECDNKVIEFDGNMASDILVAEQSRFARFARIGLDSGNPKFDAVFRLSLYKACAELGFDLCEGRFDRALCECFAAKYSDAERVWNVLVGLMKHQSPVGKLDSGRRSLYASLLLPIAVRDCIEYLDDDSLWDEYVPFSDSYGHSKYATVLEHCLCAVDYGTIFAYREGRDEPYFRAAPLLFAAVGTMSEFCAKSSRLRTYSAVIAKLLPDVNRGIESLCDARIEYDCYGAASAFANFAKGNDNFGLKVLKELTDYAWGGDVPLLFTRSDGVTAALYFVCVAEKLLGLKFNGDCVKISPNVPSCVSEIKLDILSKGNVSHIVIDNSENTGLWQINRDRIALVSEKVDLTDSSCDIVLTRREIA